MVIYNPHTYINNPYSSTCIRSLTDLTSSQKADIQTYKSKLENSKEGYSLDNTSNLRVLLSDKQLFIINGWLLRNPGSPINTYKKYELFLQKNKAIQLVHQELVKQFAGLLMMPEYVLISKVLRDSWGYDKVTVFENYKQNMKSFQDSKNKMIADHKREMQEIQDRENDYMDKFIRKEPLMAIDKISVQGLPIERILKHSDLEGDKLEAEIIKELIDYKKTLAENLLNSVMSMDDLILELKSKQ